MSFFEGIAGFMGSTVGLVLTVSAIFMIGIAVYMIKYTDVAAKGTVILFRPKDKRGEIINIGKEEEFMINCTSKDGIMRRYIKAGHGWTIKKKTIYLAIEGSGYSAVLGDPVVKRIPVVDVLPLVWGEKFTSQIPQTRMAQLATSQWMISIEPKQVDVEGTGLPRLSAEDLNDKEDTIVLEKLAKAVDNQKPKTDMMMLMLATGCGFGLCLLAVAMKWLQI